jgi:hypothetical protein
LQIEPKETFRKERARQPLIDSRLADTSITR